LIEKRIDKISSNSLFHSPRTQIKDCQSNITNNKTFVKDDVIKISISLRNLSKNNHQKLALPQDQDIGKIQKNESIQSYITDRSNKLNSNEHKEIVTESSLNRLDKIQNPIVNQLSNHRERYFDTKINLSNICVGKNFVKDQKEATLKAYNFQNLSNVRSQSSNLLKENYRDEKKTEFLNQLREKFKNFEQIKNWKESLKVIDQIIQEESSNPENYLYKAKILIKEHNFENAIKTCSEIVTLNGNISYVINNQGLFIHGDFFCKIKAI